MKITITLLTLLCLALVFGCTETPQEPEFSNPFDPNGTVGSDPYNVAANYAGHQVIVTWSIPALSGIASFIVERSSTVDGPFTTIATVEATISSYSDIDYAPNHANYYRVRALNGSAAPGPTSGVTAATVIVPPDVTIGETSTISSRQVTITVRSSSGQSVELDDQSDFSDSSSADLIEGTAEFDWDVGTATVNDEWKFLYVRVNIGGTSGETYADSIQVDFTPQLTFDGNPATLASRTTPLVMIGGSGIETMRFADNRLDLESASWVDGTDVYNDYELTAVADSQQVFGEFSSDLGLSWIDSTWAVPDSLTTIEMVLNEGEEATADSEFLVDIDAVATQMRLAGTAEDLASTAWEPYAMPVTWIHDSCESGVVKTVFVQLRNDWFTLNPTSGSVVWLPSEALGLTYTGPAAASSGTEVELTGTAVGHTCGDPLILVELDLGSGFVPATGTDDWTLGWTAPTVSEVTTVAFDWRVSDGTNEATGNFSIVVSP